MNRRELILRELGLMPLWVPRGQGAESAVDDAGSEPEVVSIREAPSASRLTPHAPASTAAAPAADDRAARIARMDWPDLREAVQACQACPLHATRKQAVLGVGDESADWLFVGEGPGAEEDARGEPFVGQAGRLLDNMLASIGLKRGQDVYIANTIKCRPPGNRTPEPQEAAQCEPFLLRQIALIQPRLIVALGKTAAGNLLRTEASLGSLRGRLHDFRGTPVLVTYHPAYLLRNLPDKAKSWEDLCLAVDTMRSLKAKAAAPI
jgi:uracil-DNA glycosylase family 4